MIKSMIDTDDEALVEIERLLRSGSKCLFIELTGRHINNRVALIKAIRLSTNAGLRESKLIMDDAFSDGRGGFTLRVNQGIMKEFKALIDMSGAAIVEI